MTIKDTDRKRVRNWEIVVVITSNHSSVIWLLPLPNLDGRREGTNLQWERIELIQEKADRNIS